MQLEDDFSDIIKKARMGLGLSVDDVARGAGLDVREVMNLERGGRQPTERDVGAVGAALKLRATPLFDIARGQWSPEALPALVTDEKAGIDIVLGHIGGYAVKGYVLYDEAAHEAAFVDTGYHAKAMLHALTRRNLQLKAVCLTHGHVDHADGLEDILAHWTVPVFLGREDEPLLSWRPPREQLTDPAEVQAVRVGRLTVRCVPTPGHTPGGICYRVEGLSVPVCFVGDTLFAGSIGRSNPFGLYATHLQSVHQKILQLPEHTVLLPGHGPSTTVREELVHNPFVRSD